MVSDEPEAIIDPVRNHDSRCNQSTLKQHKEASNLGRRHLGLPYGNGRCIAAITNASHDPTDNELCQGERRSLDGSADQHDRSTKQYGTATAELVTNKAHEKRSNETSYLIYCHHQCLDGT